MMLDRHTSAWHLRSRHLVEQRHPPQRLLMALQ
jgi:hypothetical protein